MAVALDIDLEALTEARRRDSSLPAIVADVHYLPFAPGSFDLVWNSSTFEHLDHSERVLQEMASVTRPGGCVFIGVPYRSGPLWFQRDVAHSALGVWLGTVFSRDKLSQLFLNEGLTPIRTLIYFVRFFVGILARKGSQ